MDWGWPKVVAGWQKSLKKFFKKHRFPLALILILIGTFFLFLPSFYRDGPPWGKTEPLLLTEEPIRIDPELLTAKEPANLPIRIVIPSVKIDLPIVEAKVVKGYWETSASSASHGAGSANPGERGNMVVFAHARKGLFLPLKEAKVGEIIELFTQKQVYRYEIFGIKKVKPDQVEVISQTFSERLTLYTCSGFLDRERLVVMAKPIKD